MRLLSTWMCMMTVCCANAFAAEVIVNPSVDIKEVTPQLLKLIFTMQKLYWQNGQKIHVFVLPPSSPLHKEFCYEQLHLMPYVLRHRWDRLVFSGVGERPVMLESEMDMRRQVLATPGAIGYVAEREQEQGEANEHQR